MDNRLRRCRHQPFSVLADEEKVQPGRTCVSQLHCKRADHVPVQSPFRVLKSAFEVTVLQTRIKVQAKSSRSAVPEGETA